jgi:hypothetical protein
MSENESEMKLIDDATSGEGNNHRGDPLLHLHTDADTQGGGYEAVRLEASADAFGASRSAVSADGTSGAGEGGHHGAAGHSHNSHHPEGNGHHHASPHSDRPRRATGHRKRGSTAVKVARSETAAPLCVIKSTISKLMEPCRFLVSDKELGSEVTKEILLNLIHQYYDSSPSTASFAGSNLGGKLLHGSGAESEARGDEIGNVLNQLDELWSFVQPGDLRMDRAGHVLLLVTRLPRHDRGPAKHPSRSC